MELAQGVKVDDRLQALTDWLAADGFISAAKQLISMPGDASFRRYFRLNQGSQSYVVMDAPPARENCRPFVAIAKTLRELGIETPVVFSSDLEQGFLRLTDFGDETYLKALQRHNADTLYRRALNALAVMQRCRAVSNYTLPLFNAEFMLQEWQWHKEWFLHKFLGLDDDARWSALDKCFELLIHSAATQPQVFMHRDYHSANLMVLPDSVGVLDFQDAFIGPVTYDAVSLLRDCYIAWPIEQVQQWAVSYLGILQSQGDLVNVSKDVFLQWFDWMGIERHLKALFTFSRKFLRDQQPAYLQHIPRTLNYVIKISEKYAELDALHHYMANIVQPACDKALAKCAR